MVASSAALAFAILEDRPMSESHDKDWHRIYMKPSDPVAPGNKGCHERVTPQQTGVNNVPTNGSPSKNGTGFSRKISEEERKQYAGLFGLPYIEGQQPSDAQILKFEADRAKMQTTNPQTPVTPAQPHCPPGTRYDVYQSDETQLKPITIETKKGQMFLSVATDWEKAKSMLASATEKFIAIVDDDLKVIGHYGHADAGELQIAEKFTHGEDQIDSIDEALARTDVHVVLPSRVQNKRGSYDWKYAKKGYREFLNSWQKFAVQTDIYGEVISAQELPNKNGHADSVDWSPVDLIQGGWLILKLAFKIGTKMGAKVIIKQASKKVVKKSVNRVRRLLFTRGYDARMGIPEEHLPLLIAAAKETDSIAIFRANKKAAIGLIRDGSPGKPMFFKFKTDAKTGVLTAQNADDIALVKQHGYFIVEEGGIARRYQGGKVVEEFTPTKTANWTIERNQVIDPVSKKPVVGDYDLLGVAPMKSKGSSVAGVPDDVQYGDWTGPHVEAYRKAANQQLGHPPRVLHGAQDQYGGDPNYIGLTDDTSYAIFPDGRIHIMEGKAAQQEFYDYLGRKPQGQSYPRPGPGVQVEDELAKRRKQKQGA
jgi:hypothetical protein